MFQTQNLNKATKLYEIIGKYVPDMPNENYLDYIDTIVENIKQSGNYAVYIDAIQLMTGIEGKDLLQQSPEDVLILFVNSLAEWHIVELIAFFRSVRYKL